MLRASGQAQLQHSCCCLREVKGGTASWVRKEGLPAWTVWESRGPAGLLRRGLPRRCPTCHARLRGRCVRSEHGCPYGGSQWSTHP